MKQIQIIETESKAQEQEPKPVWPSKDSYSVEGNNIYFTENSLRMLTSEQMRAQREFEMLLTKGRGYGGPLAEDTDSELDLQIHLASKDGSYCFGLLRLKDLASKSPIVRELVYAPGVDAKRLNELLDMVDTIKGDSFYGDICLGGIYTSLSKEKYHSGYFSRFKNKNVPEKRNSTLETILGRRLINTIL